MFFVVVLFLIIIVCSIMYLLYCDVYVLYRGRGRGNSSSFSLPHPQKNVDLLVRLQYREQYMLQ